MAAFLSPVFGAGAQLFNNNGIVLSGGKINTYVAGSTTPQATWTDSTQTVQNANPIILDSTGRITGSGEMWLQSGIAYKLVVTDSLNNVIGTYDNITGINDVSASASDWAATGLTPSYISGTSFSVPGNQTAVFPVNQRIRYTISAGTGYGYVLSSTFAAVTTVVIVPDSTALDSGLSAVYVGFLGAAHTAVPEQHPQMNAPITVASAATTLIGAANSLSVTVTGTVTITAFDNIPNGLLKIVKFSGILTLTHNAVSLKLPNSANIITNPGDQAIFRSLGSGNWECVAYFGIFQPSAFVSRRNTVSIGPTDISGMPSFLPQAVTGLTLTSQNIASAETIQTANVTTPVASPGVVTWTGHTLVANQAISFTTSGALPTGLVVGTTYYVLSPVTNTFNVSATPGGAAINFTGSTSGQSVAWAGVQNVLCCTSYFGNDFLYGELNYNSLTQTNLSWGPLTNNATNYLYVTIAGGVATTGFTTLAPAIVYGSTTAPSITAGQITVNVTLCESYVGNGSAAIETALVVVGTATTSGGNITATQTYSYGKPPTFTSKKSGTLLKRTVYNTAGTFTWIKLPQTTGIDVTVLGGSGGGGGSGGNATAGGNGGNGGTSSFGSLISNGIGVGTGGDINAIYTIPGGLGGATGLVGVAGINGAFAPGGAGGAASGSGGGGGGGANAYSAGGAGGAGVASGATGGGNGGSGSGGMSRGFFDASTFNSQTVTVGAGGTAGTAGTGAFPGNPGIVGNPGFVIVEEYA